MTCQFPLSGLQTCWQSPSTKHVSYKGLSSMTKSHWLSPRDIKGQSGRTIQYPKKVVWTALGFKRRTLGIRLFQMLQSKWTRVRKSLRTISRLFYPWANHNASNLRLGIQETNNYYNSEFLAEMLAILVPIERNGYETPVLTLNTIRTGVTHITNMNAVPDRFP